MTLLLSTLVCGVGGMPPAADDGLRQRRFRMPIGAHVTVTASWILAGIYLVVLVLGVQGLGSCRDYCLLFPKSAFCGGMGVLAGVLLALHSLTQTGLVPMAAGVIAGGCMIFTGVCRSRGAARRTGSTLRCASISSTGSSPTTGDGAPTPSFRTTPSKCWPAWR